MKEFRIQKREMSPDVVERNIHHGIPGEKPKWKVYICPVGSRHDNIAHVICDQLNES